MSHSDDFDFDAEGSKVEADLTSKDPAVRANALLSKARDILSEDHHSTIGLVYIEEAYETFLALGDFEKLGETAWWFGMTLMSAKQEDRALEVHLIGADAAAKSMSADNELGNLGSIAWIYKNRKDYATAARYFDMAYQLALVVAPMQAKSLANNLARAWRKVGNYEGAAELIRASVAEGRATGDDAPIVMGDQELASILMEQGKYQEALDAATEAFNIASYVDVPREAERAQYNMARALNLLERYAEALVALKEIKAKKRYRSKVKHRLRVDLEIAKAESGLGNYSVAADIYKSIIPLFDSFSVPATAVETMFYSAMNFMSMGNDLDAELMLVACMERLGDAKLPDMALNVSVLLGSIYESRSAWDQVISIYSPLVSDPTNQFSTWYPSMLSSLAMAYLKTGRKEDADSAAAAVISGGLALDPGLNLGDAYAVRAACADSVAAARRFGRKAIKAYLAEGLNSQAAELSALYL